MLLLTIVHAHIYCILLYYMQYCKGKNMCKPTHGAIRLVLKTFRMTRTQKKKVRK